MVLLDVGAAIIQSRIDKLEKAIDDLAIGANGGKVKIVAASGRQFAEERPICVGLAIEIDERVADRVLPEQKALSLGDVAG